MDLKLKFIFLYITTPYSFRYKKAESSDSAFYLAWYLEMDIQANIGTLEIEFKVIFFVVVQFNVQNTVTCL